MEKREPLGEALSDLKKKGYEADLSFETNIFALYGGDLDMRLNPDAYHVDEIDQVDDASHPHEETEVYAITICTGIKGVIVDEPDAGTASNAQHQQ
jgi:hypothetical protein